MQEKCWLHELQQNSLTEVCEYYVWVSTGGMIFVPVCLCCTFKPAKGVLKDCSKGWPSRGNHYIFAQLAMQILLYLSSFGFNLSQPGSTCTGNCVLVIEYIIYIFYIICCT